MINIIFHGFKFVVDGLSQLTSWARMRLSLFEMDQEFNIDPDDIDPNKKTTSKK